MKDMCLSKGTSSFPTEESATSKPRTGSSADISGFKARTYAGIQFQITFGREPVRRIEVLFGATDSVYAEVQRVLRIMIPGIAIS
jgi:hypothetical protein